MQFSSKLIEDAVKEMAKMPSIGVKTATRLVLHLLKQEEDFTTTLADALVRMRQEIQQCKYCHHYSDIDVCSICASPHRDKSIVCVVESSQDIMAIENTAQYNGLYHVLGGIISPMEGISPADLHIDTLLMRMPESNVKEIILAISPTMEGDTTAFYITKKMQTFPEIKISTIARGVPIGSELEYTDELTLGRSITMRTKL
jgi:recombination protein RecR